MARAIKLQSRVDSLSNLGKRSAAAATSARAIATELSNGTPEDKKRAKKIVSFANNFAKLAEKAGNLDFASL